MNKPQHQLGCVCCAAGGDMSAVDGAVREKMLRHGWAVIGAPHTFGRFGLYTVGLTQDGLPELYTSGRDPVALSHCLNDLASQQREQARPWTAGAQVRTADGRWRLEALTDEAMPMVGRLFGEDWTGLRAQQPLVPQ